MFKLSKFVPLMNEKAHGFKLWAFFYFQNSSLLQSKIGTLLGSCLCWLSAGFLSMSRR